MRNQAKIAHFGLYLGEPYKGFFDSGVFSKRNFCRNEASKRHPTEPLETEPSSKLLPLLLAIFGAALTVSGVATVVLSKRRAKLYQPKRPEALPPSGFAGLSSRDHAAAQAAEDPNESTPE
jgi:hypothetical protein